jgi:hypothetical protein
VWSRFPLLLPFLPLMMLLLLVPPPLLLSASATFPRL